MSFNIDSFRVVDLLEQAAGMRLGVIHIPTIKNAFSINVNNVRHIVRYAVKIGIRTVILPPFLPYGLTIDDLSDKSQVSSIGINKRNPYIRILKHIAFSKSMCIISPYIVEKSHGHYHVSNLIVDGEVKVCKFFSRKTILSSKEEEWNIKPGSSIDIVKDHYLKYTFQLDSDVFFVEFSKLASYMGVDVIVTILRQIDLDIESIKSFVKAINIVTQLPVINIGYTNLGRAGSFNQIPTVIVLSNSEIFEVNEKGPYLLTIPVKALKEAKRNYSMKDVKLALSIVSLYIRKLLRNYMDLKV
ncbi:MAG: hypothetical protein QXE81_01085 [Desulfurococcaceae archaeon]